MKSTLKPNVNFRKFIKFSILIHFLLFFLLGISKHLGYLSSLDDLGHFDQAVWGTLNGKLLLNSDLFKEPINRLGIHFDPILFVFVPFYAIWPNVTWFTFAQAGAVSISAWPIFLFASEVGNSEKIGFLWALSYLINPFLTNADAWDFHPVSLAVPFIALGMLAIERGNFKLLLLCSFFILLCKEHFGLMIVGFGFLWWIRHKSLKRSAALVSIGLIHFIVVLNVIMPFFSPTGKNLMISNDFFQLSRYNWIGNSVGQIIGTVFLHPFSVMRTTLIDLGGGGYLIFLLLPLQGLPLLGIEFMLPGLADFAANLLSANPMPKSIFAYHSITLIPVLTCAAIYGTKRFCRLVERYSLKEMAGFAFVANFAFGYFFAPFPLPLAKNVWQPVHLFNFPDPDMDEIRSLIPPDSSISVQENVGAHFSQRKKIFKYPTKVGTSDYIILRLKSPTKYVYSKDFKPTENFIHHFQRSPKEYIESIREILRGHDYGILYWNDPWLIFSKNTQSHIPEIIIQEKLQELESQWKYKIKPD